MKKSKKCQSVSQTVHQRHRKSIAVGEDREMEEKEQKEKGTKEKGTERMADDKAGQARGRGKEKEDEAKRSEAERSPSGGGANLGNGRRHCSTEQGRDGVEEGGRVGTGLFPSPTGHHREIKRERGSSRDEWVDNDPESRSWAASAPQHAHAMTHGRRTHIRHGPRKRERKKKKRKDKPLMQSRTDSACLSQKNNNSQDR